MAEFTRNASVIVSNASTEISSSKPAQERVDLVLFNFDAANTISVSVGDAYTAVANVGIILRPYMGISFSRQQGYTVPQGAVSAICSAASAVANLSVFERYEAR